MKIVYLKPKSSLITELRSDTLWGLIITAIAKVYPDAFIRQILESYHDNHPFFQVSSSFPYREGPEGFVYYFPKPILLSDVELTKHEEKSKMLEELQRLKLYSNVRYVTKKVFERILSGKIQNKDLFNSESWTKTHQPEIKESQVTHNTISRKTWTTLDINGSGQLFTSREHFIGKNFGLYFLVRGEKLEYIEAALRVLQHTGLGGDISVGKGAFTIRHADFTIRQPESAENFLTLSLYAPTNDELECFRSRDSQMSYDLEFRKGYIGRNISPDYEKDGVLMFKEGSILPLLSNEQYGRLVTVRKKNNILPHDIYHNGIAFHLKIKG